MKLIKEKTVLDILLNAGYEGCEVSEALDSMGPAELLNPPWEQDGKGFRPAKVAEFLLESAIFVKQLAKQLEREHDE